MLRALAMRILPQLRRFQYGAAEKEPAIRAVCSVGVTVKDQGAELPSLRLRH